MAKRGGSKLPARVETVRSSMLRALEEGPATARELSKLVGVPEADVAGHLEHLEKSLRRQGGRLGVEPSRCLDCEFEFAGRRRLTRPGRCPECRGTRVTFPVFFLSDR